MISNIEIIGLIKECASKYKKTPTIALFADEHNIHASTIVRKFGSWNKLLTQAGLKINKSSKRSDEQLLSWLKTHPNAKYLEIPFGIRSSLEERFGSISNARVVAGLSITDWRSFVKKRKYRKPNKAGRPVEYTKQDIISGLRELAIKLKRPPRMKDVTKETCGFPISALLSRFETFNGALKKADLPPSYSHHESNKITKELYTLMINIKISLEDIPIFYNLEVDGVKPSFVYKDRWEEIKLTRSEIANSINELLKYKKRCGKLVVWYLVDDSLYDNNNLNIKCIMDLQQNIGGILKTKIFDLRMKYDEISRKYIGQDLGVKV